MSNTPLDIGLITKKLDREIAGLIKTKEVKSLLLDTPIFVSTTFNDFISNKFLIIIFIQHGLPYSFFDSVQHYTPIPNEDWPGILDISSKTLLRYKENHQSFKPLQSEKIIGMAEVTHAGLEVFGGMEKFRIWLHTSNYALGKQRPIDLVKDSYGKELVLTELNNINHGIFV